MFGDIDGRNGERIGRYVHRIDDRVRKRLRDGNGNTAAAGTEIDDRADLARVGPGLKAIADELGKWRPWNEHALVDIELEPREERLVDEIGDGYAFLDAPARQSLDFAKLIGGYRPRIDVGCISVRQPEMRKYEPGSLVNRIIGAMAITKVCLVESGSQLPDQLLDGCLDCHLRCHIQGVSARIRASRNPHLIS